MAKEMATQVAAYEEHFCMFQGYRVVTSELEVTIERALQDAGSPTRIILQSSTDSTQDNNILYFIIMK